MTNTLEAQEVKRRWYGAEFRRDDAELFKQFLCESSIQYEPSEAGNLIHFELYMTMMELVMVNAWIDRLKKNAI